MISASSGNLPLFLVNYGINAARMLVPVELLTKGMQYIPFLLFQLAVTVYLASLFVHVDEIEDENQFLALSIFLGYFLASAIFEPDFGSWVRHESATFPVLHLLVMSSNHVFQHGRPMRRPLNPSSISNPNTHRHGKVKSRDEVAYRVFLW